MLHQSREPNESLAFGPNRPLKSIKSRTFHSYSEVWKADDVPNARLPDPKANQSSAVAAYGGSSGHALEFLWSRRKRVSSCASVCQPQLSPPLMRRSCRQSLMQRSAMIVRRQRAKLCSNHFRIRARGASPQIVECFSRMPDAEEANAGMTTQLSVCSHS